MSNTLQAALGSIFQRLGYDFRATLRPKARTSVRVGRPPRTVTAQAERKLLPGAIESLQLSGGAEVVCTSGSLVLRPTAPWLDQAWAPPPRLLHAGEAWRSTQSQWITLEAGQQAARFRLVTRP